ncbi:MAG: hypothetical protein H7Y42_12455 [Chitinophagaceae bacterium]|nr:hypothetical protein [Chitinophagaceae bacterium]
MKKKLTLLLLTSFVFTSMYAQKASREEINYSDPFQVDSSEYFLIPTLVDNDNKDAYGKGKGYLPWSHYSEIHFYHTGTNQIRKLFNGQRTLILPFRSTSYSYIKEPVNEYPANILNNHIVYLARTENFNDDNALDTEDPVYFYISTKSGENLTQLTPKGMNVISWTVSKDKKMILVKLQVDKNRNKKFGEGDDQVYYRIDLNDDVSKIKTYLISL